MSGEHQQHPPSTVSNSAAIGAATDAQPALRDSSGYGRDQASGSHLRIQPAATAVSTLTTTSAEGQPRRRSSASSGAMQVDHDSRHPANSAGARMMHSAQAHERSPGATQRIYPGMVGGDVTERRVSVIGSDDPEDLRRSMSSANLAQHAQFTFSSTAHGSIGTNPRRSQSTVSTSPPPLISDQGSEQLRVTSSNSRQSEEDIRMSESPRVPLGSVSYAAESSGYHHPEASATTAQASQASTPQPTTAKQEPGSRSGSQDPVSQGQSGVTLPARSAVLYHAGYNTSRGAVWRFFRVVEARVSGNTDRAECLLCRKRMLGKSADMKKHIVSNCPNRSEISADMQPILDIVKAELENPKKRAKRNSNTPITMRSDGSFAPVTSSYSTTHPENSPGAGRMLAGISHMTPTAPRAPMHPRPGPYDLSHHRQQSQSQSHPDAHREKVAKYSREYMHGSAGPHYDGASGSAEQAGRYSHGSSAMPVPPQGHSPRQPGMDSRIRSPPSGYVPRHGGQMPGPPLLSQVHQQSSTQLSHHQTPISPLPGQQQQQPPARYYPPGYGAPAGSSTAQLPQQPQQQPHAPSQRHGAPLAVRGPLLSQTPSPQITVPGSQLGRLRDKLQRRVPVFGIWLTIPSPVTARLLAAQGFDWACIDMEHTPTNPALMAEMVAAVAGSGTCVPIVRVPSHSPEWFKWALDAGAHGIIIPMVSTPDELRTVAGLCRYPPAGRRSIGGVFAPGAFGLRGARAMSDYVDYVSNDIMVIPEIESVEGAANLPNMLKMGGVDAVFVDPYALNASARSAQDMPMQDIMAHVEQTARECDIPLGIQASSGTTAGAKAREGYTLLVAASDIECLSSSAAENLDRARNELRNYR
ncbi:hypothetical protein GGF46_003551 [Coemansia sp. RSA 552]|nr:hypothetical protein GGF46_003551 [Coemansia sp. RSA 552]